LATEGEAAALLERVAPEVQALETASAQAYWEAATGGGPEAEDRYARRRAELLRRLSDPRDFAALSRLREAASGVDPLVARQVEVLHLAFAPNQLDGDTLDDLVRRETEIEGLFNRFRATFRGRPAADNELRAVLEGRGAGGGAGGAGGDPGADSGLRREAWEAGKQIGAVVAPLLRSLVERRNEAARRLGHPDHYTMALRLQEIDPDGLAALLADLRRRSDAPFAAAKRRLDEELALRFALRPEDLRPWHYGDPFFQEVPSAGVPELERCFRDRDPLALARCHYELLGLDVAGVLARSDLHPRDGKQQHAFCIDVDRCGDVRTLLNVEPGERWTSTTLHELGHAVYDVGHDPALPWLLRTPPHTSSTEAIALLMGRCTRQRLFLERVAGVEPGEAERAAAAGTALLRLSQMVFMRWCLVMVHFEREMYADPGADLDRRWWELVAELQSLTPPEDRRAPDWAAKIHLGTAPVYYQNYLLGELQASQIAWALRRELGTPAPVGAPEVGGWLQSRIFAPGSRWRWDELIRRATGAELDPGHFVRQFVDDR
jgi:peptidyl-dipeptidase A